MRMKNSERNVFKKTGYSIVTVFLFMLTFMMLTALPSWACRGGVNSGYNIEMKMVAPDSGEIFATVTFNEVSKEGKAEIARSDRDFESPSTFKLRTPPVYYDIATTADYSGNVEVCLNYRALGFENAYALRVAHHEDDSWAKLKTSVKKNNNMICVVSPSLSHFAIFEDPRLAYGPGVWFHHMHRGL